MLVCVDCGKQATKGKTSMFPVCRGCWAVWLAKYALGEI